MEPKYYAEKIICEDDWMPRILVSQRCLGNFTMEMIQFDKHVFSKWVAITDQQDKLPDIQTCRNTERSRSILLKTSGT